METQTRRMVEVTVPEIDQLGRLCLAGWHPTLTGSWHDYERGKHFAQLIAYDAQDYHTLIRIVAQQTGV